MTDEKALEAAIKASHEVWMTFDEPEVAEIKREAMRAAIAAYEAAKGGGAPAADSTRPFSEEELAAVYAGPHAQKAIDLVFGSQDGMTIGELRSKLRRLAPAAPPAVDLEKVEEALEALRVESTDPTFPDYWQQGVRYAISEVKDALSDIRKARE